MGNVVPQHTCRGQRTKSRVSPCLPHCWISRVHCYMNQANCSISFQTLPPTPLYEWDGITEPWTMHMDFTGFWDSKPRLVDRLTQWPLYPLKHLSSLIYIHFNSTRKWVLSSIDWCAGPAFKIGHVFIESHINNIGCPHAKEHDVILKACWSHMHPRWCWREIPLASSAVVFPISTGSQWVKNSMTVHWMN